MSISLNINLENGTTHDVQYGDVFNFNYRKIKDTPFAGSNFGRDLFEKNPEQVIFSIIKNNLGFLGVQIDYYKNDQVFDTFQTADPQFFYYVQNKNLFSFLKNEEKEWKDKRVFDIQDGDIFLCSFKDFENANYLKNNLMPILKEKNPEQVIIHFYDVKKEINYLPTSLSAKVYAVNKKEFLNLETKEEVEKNKKYRDYEPDKAIIEYIFNHLKTADINFMTEKGLLKNKVSRSDKYELDFEDISHLIPEKPKNKRKP